MKKILSAIPLLFAALAFGQSSGLPAPSVSSVYPNAGTTGTTLNALVKLTGAPSTAVITATTDTSGAIGVCTANCGTSGVASIQLNGLVGLVMDGATTAGDYVQISSTVAGNGHDAGAACPSSGQVVGRVLSTNATGGTYQVNLGSNGCGSGSTSGLASINSQTGPAINFQSSGGTVNVTTPSSNVINLEATGSSSSSSANISQSPYYGSDLSVDYCTVTNGSNVLTCNSTAGWTSNQGGIWIAPIQTGVGASIPLAGTVCDHVTVSGNTLTMLNSGGSACNANFTSGSNQGTAAIHTYTVKGYGTSSTNTLTLTATDATFANGMGIKVIGAGAAGADLICPKITISGTAVTMFQSDGTTACNIGTTISSGTPAQVWHDDSLALQSAVASGSNVYAPRGSYYLSSETDITTPLKLNGDGRAATYFVVTKDAIKAIAQNTSGSILRDFFIGTVDTFTPTSGTLVSLCDGTVSCFDNEIGYLTLYGGAQQIQVLNHAIQAWVHDNYGLDAHTNAVYYNNPQPYGDIPFSNNMFVSCNTVGCNNSGIGLRIDASDTTSWEGNKFNEFKTGIYIAATSGNVKNQRFIDNSCEKAGNNTNSDICVDIEGGANTKNITWLGGEIGMFNAAGTGLKVGANVTNTTITGGTTITSDGGSGIGVDNSGNASVINGVNFYYTQMKNESAAGSVSIINNNFDGNTVSLNILGSSTAANGPITHNLCFPNACEVDNSEVSVLGTGGGWNFNNSSPSPDANFVAATFKASYPNVILEIPVATSSQQGIMKPDGTTCTVASGTLTCTGSAGATSIPICTPSSASGTTYACTTSPSFTPVAGSVIAFKPDVSNTGTATLNVNSQGAKSIAKWQTTTALSANDLRANTYTVMTYDGTNWEAQTIGNAPNAAALGTPQTIPNLFMWFHADATPNLQNNGTIVKRFIDAQDVAYTNSNTAGGGATFTTSAINSLPSWTFGGTAATAAYSINAPVEILAKSTVFIVFNNTSGCTSGAGCTHLSGPTGAYEVDLVNGTNQQTLTKTFTSAIANCTCTITAGTWYQFNATYDSSSGAYAMRLNEASAGSGTNAVSITAATDSYGYNKQGNSAYVNGQVAEIIVYNRVLSGGEIATIEAYLNAKYGI